MNVLSMIENMMVVSVWSKVEAREILMEILNKLDPVNCPKMSAKVVGDLEFYCEHCNIRLSNKLIGIMEDIRAIAIENL